MTDTNRRVLLKSRPQGEPTKANFDVVDAPLPEPKDGEYLSRTIWLSLDPYMRGRMSDGPSYAQPVPVGGVMEAGTVSEVIASNNPAFAKGDIVARRLADARDLRRQGACEDRSHDRANLDRSGCARHARHDRVYGPA